MSWRILCWMVMCSIATAGAKAADRVSATQPATAESLAPSERDLPAMHFDKTSPREAFEQLAKEADGVLAIEGASAAAAFWDRHSEPLSLDFSPVPYWLALHELCAAAKITARASTRHKIVLEEAKPLGECKFAAVHGVVQIELDSMRDTRQMIISNSRTSTGDCRFSVRVTTPAGLHAIRNEPIKFTSFTDQDDKPIEGLRQFPGFWTDGKALLELAFHRDSPVQKISRIAGEMNIVLQGELHTIEIDDIRNSGRVERTVCGMHFDFVPRYAPGVLDVEVTVAQQGDIVVWDDARRDVAMTMPQLFDGKGGKYLMSSSGSGGGPQMHLELHYRSSPLFSPRLGEPQKLVWKFSTGGRTAKIPFEFKDIPLRMQ